MVILTSFVRRNDFVGQQFSVARWAPKGISVPVLDFLGAEGVGAVPIHLTDFKDPIKEFAAAYAAGLKERWEYVSAWLDELDPKIDLVLLCWCGVNGSKNSMEFFAQTGIIACHNLLIGRMIRRHRPEIEIVLDSDREHYAPPEWKP
jgi:hypothetical protein